MDLDRHDFQLDELVEKIKSNDHRLVALQVPEGLKMQALEMMDQIEDDSGAKVILAADPCYGACDLVHDNTSIYYIYEMKFSMVRRVFSVTRFPSRGPST